MLMLIPLVVALALAGAKPPPKKTPPNVRTQALKLLGVEAASWSIVSSSDTSVSFVQRDRVTKERAEAEAWILTVYIPRSKTTDGESYGSTFNLEKYDCSGSKYQILEYVAYSGQNRDGKIVERLTEKYPEWDRVIPGTVLEARLESICRPEEVPVVPQFTPDPSIRLPNFYYMLSSDGQSTSSLTSECSYVAEEPEAADCKITQLSVRHKLSPDDLQAEQERVRKEAAAENFDPTSKSAKETCAALAKGSDKPLSPVVLARIELFRQACAAGTKDAWIKAVVDALVFDTRTCKVNALDTGTYRFRQSSPGVWKYSGIAGACEFKLDITITQKDGFAEKYTSRRIRTKTDDFCAKFDKDNSQAFDRSKSSFAMGCDEVEFGF